LAWLDANAMLDPAECPERRVTAERVSAYANEMMATTAPFSVQGRIGQLGNALRAMAPHQDWRWVLRGADRIRARATPVRDKRARLQMPNRLADLGFEVMAEANASTTGRAVWRAADYRDGLIIALLAHRPLRARNLTMIECGVHLVRDGSVWRLVFTARETKTKEPIDEPFPIRLVSNLETYLAVHRPILLDVGRRNGRPPTEALWVSGLGRAMTYSNIRFQVTLRTKAAFGEALSPHLFRDCCATSIAIADPEHVHLIPSLLEHRSLRTSERHYNQAHTLEAGRRFQDTQSEIRRRAAASSDTARMGSGALDHPGTTGDDP
jgi:integrase/recombinase XerD